MEAEGRVVDEVAAAAVPGCVPRRRWTWWRGSFRAVRHAAAAGVAVRSVWLEIVCIRVARRGGFPFRTAQKVGEVVGKIGQAFDKWQDV